MIEVEEDPSSTGHYMGSAGQEEGRGSLQFPRLQHLSLRGQCRKEEETDAALLLPVSTMPELRSLVLNIWTQGTYCVILDHLRSTSPGLETLQIETSDGAYLRPCEAICRDDVLELGGVRKLTLSSRGYAILVNDATLARIGRSLPELRELRIDCHPRGGYRATIPRSLALEGSTHCSERAATWRIYRYGLVIQWTSASGRHSTRCIVHKILSGSGSVT